MPTRPEPAGQAAFTRALLDPRLAPPADLAPVGGKPPVKRFAVYRNNVVHSLITALADGYPAIRRILGDEAFRRAAGVYARAHPPKTPMMIFYGESFGDWLERFEPLCGQPFLADVARLEWARRQAYHAADADALDAAGFAAACAAVPAEAQGDLRLRTHPSLRLASSRHPVFSIWAGSLGEQVEPSHAGECVLVIRRGDQVPCLRISAGVVEFLTALGDDATLGEAVAAAMDRDAAFDLSGALSAAVDAGAFIEVTR